jgi:hypothetical protein
MFEVISQGAMHGGKRAEGQTLLDRVLGKTTQGGYIRHPTPSRLPDLAVKEQIVGRVLAETGCAPALVGNLLGRSVVGPGVAGGKAAIAQVAIAKGLR